MGIRRLGRPTGYNYPTGLSVSTPANTTIDYLVVAGGGAGGFDTGGAGGAGGFLTGSGTALSNSTSYSVTVGAGGAPSPSTTTPAATSGSYSLFTPSAPANTFYY